MQTVIMVVTTGGGSLRNKIMSDSQLEKKFKLVPSEHQRPGVLTAGRKFTAREKRTASSTWNGTAAPVS
jgi:hypothetical protein